MIIQNYEGVPVTHSWFSSVFFDKFLKPLFALPGSYKVTESGIEISRSKPNFSASSVVQAHDPDLFLRPSGGEQIIDKKVEAVGEWDIRVRLNTSSGQKISMHVIKGSPVLYFRSDGNVSLTGSIRSIEKLNDKFIIIKTLHNNNYLVSLNSAKINGNSVDFGKDMVATLIILPDDYSSERISQIFDCSQNEPSTTSFSFKDVSEQKITINYSFSNDIFKKDYLFTLWPHQKQTGELGNYATSRGNLSLTCAKDINLDLDARSLPLSWSSLISKSDGDLIVAKKLFAEDKIQLSSSTISQGVYFKGKYLKNLVDLWELSKILGLISDSAELEIKLKDMLVSEIDNFSFDEKTGMVMHKYPEFGSEKGNDHHFQYSYYIYSYSKLFDSFNKEDKDRVKKLMDLFVSEGMPGFKNSQTYPRKIRFLDPIESHSWADGQALFGDGNNQESSSEVLFYWYSLYVWSQTAKDDKLSDWSRFAYFSELSGTNSYWFLQSNPGLSQNFGKPISSIVWGGKDDYATWFSSDEDKIFGIHVLPINPSSFISLKVKDPSKIVSYYDKIFGLDEKIKSLSFGNYYLLFKKINGISSSFSSNYFQDEFNSKALLYLLR